MSNRNTDGKFTKGVSGNAKGRPKKSTISASVISTGSKSKAPEKKPQDLDKNITWIPFGSDNLFPQALADLARKSPVHRAILNSKKTYTIGKGYFTSDDRLAEYIKEVNSKGESLTDVAKKIYGDQYHFGNSYLIVTAGEGFINLSHQDATKCRVKKDGKAILIHGDWSVVKPGEKKEIEKIVEIPLYPEFKMVQGQQRSIIHMKSYEPEFSFYGIPEYIAAIDAAGIGYKTNKWNISRLDNGFQSSGVLLVSGDMSVDDAQKLKEKFKDEFTGEGNQGKIMFIAKNIGGETDTTFTPINDGNDGDWMDLHRQSTSDLVTSHGWFPSLAGIEVAGKLGNSSEIRNSYQLALNTIIQPEQEFLNTQLDRVLKESFDTDDLEVINKPPINFVDLIDINFVVTKGEARAMLGLEVDEDDERMNETVKKDGTANNTAGSNQ